MTWAKIIQKSHERNRWSGWDVESDFSTWTIWEANHSADCSSETEAFCPMTFQRENGGTVNANRVAAPIQRGQKYWEIWDGEGFMYFQTIYIYIYIIYIYTSKYPVSRSPNISWEAF